MADTRLRVDRTIAAMSEKQKAELLDLHIGPTLAGSTPDPESDAKYLRDLVEGQLRAQDEQKASGLAALERRIAKLERFLKADLVAGLAEALVDCVQQQLRDGGYMRHCGTWDTDHAYRKGDCVVDGGGTWLAIADTAKGIKPGKGLEWRLIARGDAGKGSS
jgi:hypothetical protein